ncbi:MAG: Clp1/GlmU family protein [Nitrospirota bacterium]
MNLIIDKLAGVEGWETAASRIASDKGVAIILGAPDSGKTTFARFLVDYLTKKQLSVAMVDADMGQSTLGPPTTIGMSVFKSAPHWLEDIPCRSLHFVGSTSPEKHFISTIVGVKKMTESALGHGADITLIDTSGLVYGNAGRLLKSQKIDIINPAHIIAIQESDEIEHLLLPYIKQNAIKIHRLMTSADTKIKSKEQRRSYREIKFQGYFRKSMRHRFVLGSVGILGSFLGSGRKLSANDIIFLSKTLDANAVHAEIGFEEVLIIVKGGYSKEGIIKTKRHFLEREIIINELNDFKFLIAGINDEKNNTLGIGIIEEIDLPAGIITVITPLHDIEMVRILHFGSIKLDLSGKEINM